MNEINIIYRDIKPENILIKYLYNKKEDFNIKLTNYELCRELYSTTINLT